MLRNICHARLLGRNIASPLAGLQGSRCESSESAKPNVVPDLPDFNTSVNIHEHKLTRPTGPPKKLPRWKELNTLKETTKGSLIPETLKQMEEDEDFKLTAKMLKEMGQKQMTKDEKKKRQRALDNLGIPNFLRFYKQQQKQHGIENVETTLTRRKVQTLQLNIGIYCNQACSHCHVESSPKRPEMMDRETAERCVQLLANSPSVHTVDITGGAPELCSQFRFLVEEITKLGRTVIDRCNLTALLEPGQEDTAQFLADHKVHVIASLPCYSAKNVNMQRGKGVFAKSIQALIDLNELGYGQPETGLKLDLVYNPLGAYLPPPQDELELQYKKELYDNFSVEFNQLFAFTNFPIKRFADFLIRRGELESYMDLLVRNYNLNAVDKVMCRDLVNVDWRGRVYDCDFNQQLDMSVPRGRVKPRGDKQGKPYLTVWDLDSCGDLQDKTILTDNHCFGCTAGMGAS